jgi:hypothetical protein
MSSSGRTVDCRLNREDQPIIPLSKRDDSVRQAKHSRIASYVIDTNQSGYTVVWSQGVVRQFIRYIVVMGELIGRRYHPA